MKKRILIMAAMVLALGACAQAPSMYGALNDTSYVSQGDQYTHDAIPSGVTLAEAEKAFKIGPQHIHQRLVAHDDAFWFLFEDPKKSYDELYFDGQKLVYLVGQEQVLDFPGWKVWWAIIGVCVLFSMLCSPLSKGNFLILFVLGISIAACSILFYSVTFEHTGSWGPWTAYVPVVSVILLSLIAGVLLRLLLMSLNMGSKTPHDEEDIYEKVYE